MNTITKTAILEAEKLATLYAGELRGKGFTPKQSPAVTPEKTLRCEFQNGELNKIVLPLGRLSDWARTFKGEAEFDVEWAGSKLVLNCGNSRITFADQAASLSEKALSSLAQVPPLRFDDNGGNRRDFQLVTPADSGNLSAKLKSRAAAQKLAKLRAAEIAAKSAFKLAIEAHRKNIADCSPEQFAPALAMTRQLQKSLRMLRAAFKAPLDVIPWLGESITPPGEYDDKSVILKNLTPEHWELCAAVYSARSDVATYKPIMRKSRWDGGGEPSPVYGPKYQALQNSAVQALANVRQWIIRQWQQELAKNNLPAVFVYSSDNKLRATFKNDCRTFTRARLAVRQWPAQKTGLANVYTPAFQARRKFEHKALEAGRLIQARAIHADGTVKTGVVSPEKYAELQTMAADNGAKLEVVFATGQAAESVAVKHAPSETEIEQAVAEMAAIYGRSKTTVPAWEYIGVASPRPDYAGENI